MGRIAVGIEYDGSAYCGWQIQSSARSIEAEVRAAVSHVADTEIDLTCAGRTDAGVHARAQVAHFDSTAARSARAWVLGSNDLLPPDISLRWAQAVPDHFHARYSAQSRTYRYVIVNRIARPALAARRALCVHKPLDIAAMRAAGAYLIGEHDFSGFRAAECQARSPVRELRAIEIERAHQWLWIDVTANAFLHHMVRNIVGLLLAVGRGDQPPERARQQLESRQRSSGEATAAAHGLYLWRVEYAVQFGLPDDSAIIGAPGCSWF